MPTPPHHTHGRGVICARENRASAHVIENGTFCILCTCFPVIRARCPVNGARRGGGGGDVHARQRTRVGGGGGGGCGKLRVHANQLMRVGGLGGVGKLRRSRAPTHAGGGADGGGYQLTRVGGGGVGVGKLGRSREPTHAGGWGGCKLRRSCKPQLTRVGGLGRVPKKTVKVIRLI